MFEIGILAEVAVGLIVMSEPSFVSINPLLCLSLCDDNPTAGVHLLSSFDLILFYNNDIPTRRIIHILNILNLNILIGVVVKELSPSSFICTRDRI